ncbi:MAG TPA: hypothetical protein VEO54_29100 [Thermoanaerobaculia bacterium]|nr:hypothetical protein [Thermoanaerobaculia bacterium]
MNRGSYFRALILIACVLFSVPALPCEYCVSWENIETGELYKECTATSEWYSPQYAGCQVVSFCGGKKGAGGVNCTQECDGQLCVIA